MCTFPFDMFFFFPNLSALSFPTLPSPPPQTQLTKAGKLVFTFHTILLAETITWKQWVGKVILQKWNHTTHSVALARFSSYLTVHLVYISMSVWNSLTLFKPLLYHHMDRPQMTQAFILPPTGLQEIY